MALPEFRKDGWLPEGHHAVTWEEIALIFGGQPDSRRDLLLQRLLTWRDDLRSKGAAGRLILDGSFISTKEIPGDIDCLLVYDDSRIRLSEEPETKYLVDYTTLKSQGLGDVFVFPLSLTMRYPTFFHEDAFDYDKITGQTKGVAEVEL